MRAEAVNVAKYLVGLSLKMRRTQLVIEQAGRRLPVNCEYVIGTKLHYAIMTHKEQILKLCPTMDSHKSFNGLNAIQDSCQLVMGLISLGAMNRVIPLRMQYPDPNDPAAKKPKAVEILPMEHMQVAPTGMYIFQVEVGKMKTQLWLIFCVGLAFFFLLFRVWPDWLRQAVWYLSWYALVFLVATAIIRAIVWFLVFHVGVDFWIFPNYFIDSDNIMDSFWPILSLEKREDMFDIRMLVVRIVSACAIAYGVQEFLQDPENIESVMSGSTELWDEMYTWGHHKFMGTVDPNQQIEVKKSARQIYAEAFMDDENPMFRTNTHFANFADEDAVREAQAKWEEDQKLTAEERARRAFEEALEDEEEPLANDDRVDEESREQEPQEDAEDLLDKLTGNIDDDGEPEAADPEERIVQDGEEALEETKQPKRGGAKASVKGELSKEVADKDPMQDPARKQRRENERAEKRAG